jgi:hypothetical protein
MDDLDVQPGSDGVSYTAYSIPVNYPKQPEIYLLKSSKKGVKGDTSVLGSMDLDTSKSWAICIEAYILIDEDGDYEFYTDSKDGSMLYIDNRLIVDNGGIHDRERVSGSIGLEKGYHQLRLEYFMTGSMDDAFAEYGIVDDNMKLFSLS